MNKATVILFLTLSSLAGIMGIEHGVGEVLQGFHKTDTVLIQSWPDSSFFEIMAGEPAMTIIPNYLITGIIAILISGVFLFVSIKHNSFKNTSVILFVLSISMLMIGGGFGPPIVAMIAILISLKKNSTLYTWNKLPSKFHNILSKCWPWSFVFCLCGWLMLFPGAPVIALLTGINDSLIMLIPITVAFTFIPITLLLGFSNDIINNKNHLNKI